MLFDNILLALEGLKSNKLRSFLTMLGIIIGIGSVITISTVGSSLTGYVSDSMSSLGGYSIDVTLTQKSSDNSSDTSSNVKIRDFKNDTPSESDLITDNMIAQYKSTFSDSIKYIETACDVGTAEYDDSSLTVTGVNDEYEQAEEITMLYGRFIVNEKDSGKKLAVVADSFVKDTLGLNEKDAVGESFTVTIDGTPYKFYIAGIYKYESDTVSTDSDSDENEVTALYIPLSTAKTISSSGDGYQSITVIADKSVDTESFMNTTGDFFASFYTQNDSWTATASSMQEMLSTVTSMIKTISYAVAAIAAISLLVGGIGVMNIMLVSITERTNEIGTRKALGAPNSSIRLQFVTEAAVICLVGGITGVALGISAAAIIGKILGYGITLNIGTIFAAVAFSVLIGLVFGFAPANKAAKLDPIEALRYE